MADNVIPFPRSATPPRPGTQEESTAGMAPAQIAAPDGGAMMTAPGADHIPWTDLTAPYPGY